MKKEEEEEEVDVGDGGLTVASRDMTRRDASTPSPKPETTLLLEERAENKCSKKNGFLKSIAEEGGGGGEGEMNVPMSVELGK